MSKFEGVKNGDRVQVIVEGEVTFVREKHIEVGDHYLANDDRIINVQIIEPEYEKFAPGDLVRWIHAGDDTVFALGNDGFLITSTGKFARYGERGCRTLDQFTTKEFVQVFIP